MNLNNANILVTGGCGFIGTNFILYVLNKYPDCRIFNFDLGFRRHYAAKGKNLKDLELSQKRYHPFLDRDIRDFDTVKFIFSDLLKKYENLVVVHFAADSHVTRSETNPKRFYGTNFIGTANLLVALSNLLMKRQEKVRFIHVSTDEVYGPAEKDVFFKEEEGVGKATSPYARSKARADSLAQLILNDDPFLRTVIVRPTNNFGPYMFPEKFLSRSITRLIQGKNAIVWGKGEQIRDWLFVEDTCRAICLILEKDIFRQIYNIGANHEPEITNAEIIRMVVKEMGLSENRIQFTKDPRPDHDFRYGVDTTRICGSLNWQTGNFQEQLCETIRWYQENQNWWLPLIKEAESIYQEEEK